MRDAARQIGLGGLSALFFVYNSAYEITCRFYTNQERVLSLHYLPFTSREFLYFLYFEDCFFYANVLKWEQERFMNRFA